MSINFNIFQSGLNGGTKALTGDENVPVIENGTFQGFVVVNSCYITSILNQDGIEVINNVLLNGNVTNITNKLLVNLDIIQPDGQSEFFTQITMRNFSNKSQIILYLKN